MKKPKTAKELLARLLPPKNRHPTVRERKELEGTATSRYRAVVGAQEPPIHSEWQHLTERTPTGDPKRVIVIEHTLWRLHTAVRVQPKGGGRSWLITKKGLGRTYRRVGPGTSATT